MIIYPLIWMFIWNTILDFILLLDKYKRMTRNVKHILEVFPESVIIRSVRNESQEPITDFVNHSAQDNFLLEEMRFCWRLGCNNQFKILKELEHEEEELNHKLELIDVLEYLEYRSENSELQSVINVKMIDWMQTEERWENWKYFTVKTIKVEWESNQNAFMHVFINISNIKKLEKERATNKWLHIMFSSISHEFRTPLNAFMNALHLIKLNFESIKEILVDKGFELETRKYWESMQRNITTATVSSKICKSV